MSHRTAELGPELESRIGDRAVDEHFVAAVADHFGFRDSEALRAAFRRYSRVAAALIARGEGDE